MAYIKRNYRTNLAMLGLIYLDGIELECTIMDLSTTGARLEIIPKDNFCNPVPFAQTIANDSIIDIRIPEMHMDGEVKIIRKEIKQGLLYLSVVFANVFFGLENVPYKRTVYRKKLSTFGHLVINDETHEVATQNVSVKGLLLVVYRQVESRLNQIVEINFKHLNIHGSAKIIWHKISKKNHTWIGVEYVQLDNPVKGVASFPLRQRITD